MAIFRHWARKKGLKPSETQYTRSSRTGTAALQFTASGDPELEKSYRTHFVSPALSEKKQRRLEEKLNQSPKPVVFQNLREAQCSECGAVIERDSFLSMELEQPLCLQCARLDDLEFLPSGDTALTRRASKYSVRVAVVVRFSRTRGRYERQGILVETAGLEKAERECLEDADERAVARARGAERRQKTGRRIGLSNGEADRHVVPQVSGERGRRHRRTHRPTGKRPGWAHRGRTGISRNVP